MSGSGNCLESQESSFLWWYQLIFHYFFQPMTNIYLLGCLTSVRLQVCTLCTTPFKFLWQISWVLFCHWLGRAELLPLSLAVSLISLDTTCRWRWSVVAATWAELWSAARMRGSTVGSGRRSSQPRCSGTRTTTPTTTPQSQHPLQSQTTSQVILEWLP